MKEYRKSIADISVLKQVLEYIAGCADSLNSDATDYRERAQIDADEPNSYYLREASECEAKCAAFERLLEKLAK